jgi:NADP-dependent 3-hydroxy acid dehydrogenase YdfG
MTKTVLITGCSSGIGRATAQVLASNGFDVYATARRTESIADLEAAGCKTLALDVTSEESMAAAVAAIPQGIDALVNNAGIQEVGAIESVPMDRVRGLFETNVFGPVRLAQLVLPQMRERGAGTILTVGSMNGKFTWPGTGYYCGTKHALEAISDALRYETRPFGVRTVLVEPDRRDGDARVQRRGRGADDPQGADVRPTARPLPRGAVGRALHDAAQGAAGRGVRRLPALADAEAEALEPA